MNDLAARIAAIESAGFRRDPDKAHVLPFTGKRTGKRIYLKHKVAKLSVVFHPSTRSTLTTLADAHRLAEPYDYFNSNMTDFPAKNNRGQNDEKYGLALDFRTIDEMRDFLRGLA